MQAINSIFRVLPLWLLGLSFLVAPGCVTCGRLASKYGLWTSQDHCADIPKGAIPLPPATYGKQWQHAHAGAAAHDQFRIYGADWRAQSAQLAPFGLRRFEQMVARMHEYPYAIVIDRSESPALDEVRRGVLIAELANRGVPDAAERVVVGYSNAYALYGIEAKTVARGAFEREPSANTTAPPFHGTSGGLRSAFGGGFVP